MDRNKRRKYTGAISALMIATYCAACFANPLSISGAPPWVVAQGDQDLRDLLQRFTGRQRIQPDIGPDDPLDWDLPRLSIKDAALSFYTRLGVQGTVDAHDMDFLVGPFRGRFTPRELWSLMMDAGCADARISETGHTYSASPKSIPGLNDVKTHYDLPAAPLVDMVLRLGEASKGLPLTIAPAMFSQLTVGPIVGDMTMEEALQKVLAQIPEPGYTYLYLESPSEIALISNDVDRSRPDLTQGPARARLCLARIPPKSESMLVVATHLPAQSGNDIAEPTVILDRRRIEETGADSVPDLLAHLAQTAFHRGRGYRASGAQYAELRGVGHQFTKVLINGRPTFGTAADLMDGAFDLNAVPISAVERVEIILDAVSLAQGADAIGGTVNLVLRDGGENMAEARYESASGGAVIYRGSIIAGAETESSRASVVLDYSHIKSLLGASRDRWRNQDWTQHGGTDHRSVASAPPNVQSMDGLPLPGLSSSSAAVSIDGSGSPVFRAGQQNLTSLLAWQSIVPESRRASALVTANQDIGFTSVSSEVLISRRNNVFQFGPEVISDFTLGATHPQNPFGAPVLISAALTGLPPVQLEYDSTLMRGVLSASGTIGERINYDSYLLHTSDRVDSLYRHQIDAAAVYAGVSDGAAVPFDIISDAPGEGSSHAAFLTRGHTQTQKSGLTQMAGSVNGTLWRLPAGAIVADIGMEARREFARFNSAVGRTDRDVVAGYGSIQVPVLRNVTAEYGLRRDDYADLVPVISHQYVLRWKPSAYFRTHVSYCDAFDPPELWDLDFPQTFLRSVPIYDPKRGEVVPVTLIAGGNKDLQPTTGHASSIGISVGQEREHFASLSVWEISLKNRIATVPLQSLLANEDDAIAGRIFREQASVEDVTHHRPGRLSRIDITRANFGSTQLRGIDLTLAATLRTSIGSVRSRLEVSYTDEFRFSDLPTQRAPARERTGIASAFGTITDWRLRGSLNYENEGWSLGLLARYNSCYADVDPVKDQFTGSDICSGIGLDANVSRELSEHVRITLGVADLYTSSVPFSRISDTGFDTSQRDLAGPTGYLSVAFK